MEDDRENNNNFCSKGIMTCAGRVARIFRAWEKGWEKAQFDSMGDEKFAAWMPAMLESLKWGMWVQSQIGRDASRQLEIVWHK